MTLNQLLGLQLDRMAKSLRRWLLRRLINAEYCNLAFFQWQVENGAKGVSDTTKRIVNLEAEERGL